MIEERKVYNGSNSVLSSMSKLLEGDILWLVSDYSNSLLKISIGDRKLLKVYRIPVDKFVEFSIHSISKDEKNIYLVPYVNDIVWIFHIDDESFEAVKVPLKKEEGDLSNKFCNSYLYKNKLYMLGFEINGIYIMDTLNRKFMRLDMLIKKIKEAGISVKYVRFCIDYYVDKNKMIIPLAEESCIVEIDMDYDDIIIHRITDERLKTKGFYTIDKCINGWVLSNAVDQLIQLNEFMEVENVEDVNELFTNQEEDISRYLAVYDYDDKRWFIPACEAKIFYIENGTKKFLEFDYPYNNSLGYQYYQKWEFILKKGNVVLLQSSYYGRLFALNLSNASFKEIEIKIPFEQKKKIIMNVANLGFWMTKEGDLTSMEEFIRCIVERDKEIGGFAEL